MYSRYCVAHAAGRLEFIFNDGKDDWDHPPSNNNGHYIVEEAGSYFVQQGVVTKCHPKSKPPTLLVPQRVSSSQIEISWNPPDMSNVKQYKVYRDSTCIASLPSCILTFLDSHLQAGMHYTYQISGVNPSGIESNKIELTVKTLPIGRPGRPIFLTVLQQSEKSITLRWQQPRQFNGQNVAAYRIYRDNKLVSTEYIGHNYKYDTVFTWEDKNVEAGEEYTYYVRALRMARSLSGTFLFDEPVLRNRNSHANLSNSSIALDDNEGSSSEHITVSAASSSSPRIGDGECHILMQAFHWGSWNEKYLYKNLLTHVDEIASNFIDTVWLPPVSHSVDHQGYLPCQWYKLDTHYGKEADLRKLVSSFKKKGIGCMADMVLNHRCASEKGMDGNWTEFVNPNWSHWAICRDAQQPGGTGNLQTGSKKDARMFFFCG